MHYVGFYTALFPQNGFTENLFLFVFKTTYIIINKKVIKKKWLTYVHKTSNHPFRKILFQINVINIKFQDMRKSTTVVCIAVNKSLCRASGIFLENNINTISGNLPLTENFRKVPERSSVPA